MKNYSQLTELDKQKIYEVIFDFVKDNTICDNIYFASDNSIDCIKELVNIIYDNIKVE